MPVCLQIVVACHELQQTFMTILLSKDYILQIQNARLRIAVGLTLGARSRAVH